MMIVTRIIIFIFSDLKEVSDLKCFQIVTMLFQLFSWSSVILNRVQFPSSPHCLSSLSCLNECLAMMFVTMTSWHTPCLTMCCSVVCHHSWPCAVLLFVITPDRVLSCCLSSHLTMCCRVVCCLSSHPTVYCRVVCHHTWPRLTCVLSCCLSSHLTMCCRVVCHHTRPCVVMLFVITPERVLSCCLLSHLTMCCHVVCHHTWPCAVMLFVTTPDHVLSCCLS